MKLALGTVQFGQTYGITNQTGQITIKDGKAIIAFAKSAGIETIDTAIAYGDSEANLGKIDVSTLKIVTKLPPIPDGIDSVDEWINKQIKNSLARLNVESTYGLLVHNGNQLLGKNGIEIARALQLAKNSGYTHKIGISIYDPDDLGSMKEIMDLDIVQAPLNIIDRRLIVSGWAKRLHDSGTEIHSRSTFLQGLLLLGRGEIPNQFTGWNPMWKKWHDWLEKTKIPAAEACLQYALSHPEIKQVVIGIDNIDHLKSLVTYATQKNVCDKFIDLQSTDLNLINPANWIRPT